MTFSTFDWNWNGAVKFFFFEELWKRWSDEREVVKVKCLSLRTRSACRSDGVLSNRVWREYKSKLSSLCFTACGSLLLTASDQRWTTALSNETTVWHRNLHPSIKRTFHVTSAVLKGHSSVNEVNFAQFCYKTIHGYTKTPTQRSWRWNQFKRTFLYMFYWSTSQSFINRWIYPDLLVTNSFNVTFSDSMNFTFEIFIAHAEHWPHIYNRHLWKESETQTHSSNMSIGSSSRVNLFLYRTCFRCISWNKTWGHSVICVHRLMKDWDERTEENTITGLYELMHLLFQTWSDALNPEKTHTSDTHARLVYNCTNCIFWLWPVPKDHRKLFAFFWLLKNILLYDLYVFCP